MLKDRKRCHKRAQKCPRFQMKFFFGDFNARKQDKLNENGPKLMPKNLHEKVKHKKESLIGYQTVPIMANLNEKGGLS